MDKIYLDIYNLIWKEVFGEIKPLAVEKFKELFTKELGLPIKKMGEEGGGEVFVGRDYGYKRVIHEDTLKAKESWMREKTEIKSLQQLLETSKSTLIFRGNRALNCETYAESDNIYSSSFVFNSTDIHQGQKILFSEGLSQCEYLMASKGSGSCTFGIRIMDSGKTSNSFDIDWSSNVVNSYFCHDSYDLRDCMFCFHVTSKQFCIGNQQLEEAEYKDLKKRLLGEYMEQLDKPGAFVTLKDL